METVIYIILLPKPQVISLALSKVLEAWQVRDVGDSVWEQLTQMSLVTRPYIPNYFYGMFLTFFRESNMS